jgi:hypothetical protein
LYSNRAACHLKLRNFFKAIEDCSKVNISWQLVLLVEETGVPREKPLTK